MRAVIKDLRGFFSAPPFNFTWIGDASGKLMARNFGDNLISEITMYFPMDSTHHASLKPYDVMKNQILAKEGEDWELLYFRYPCLNPDLRDYIDYIGEYGVFEDRFMSLVCKKDLSKFVLDSNYEYRQIDEFAFAIDNIRLLDYFSKTTGNEIDRTLKMFDFYINNRETLPPKPKYVLNDKTGNSLIQDALNGKYRFNFLADVNDAELRGIITQLKFKYLKDFKPSFKDYAHLI